MNRRLPPLRSSVVAAIVAAIVLAPTTAGASDENVVVAVNRTDGRSLVRANVDYRKVTNGKVDEENRAYAAASCTGCKTLAAAFQLVLVIKPPSTLAPQNEAASYNVECVDCVTWASAKQIVVETGGAAELTRAGRARLQAVENGLLAMEDELPAMTLEQLQAAVDGAFAEFLDIAQTEIVRTDGRANDARVVAARES